MINFINKNSRISDSNQFSMEENNSRILNKKIIKLIKMIKLIKLIKLIEF